MHERGVCVGDVLVCIQMGAAQFSFFPAVRTCGSDAHAQESLPVSAFFFTTAPLTASTIRYIAGSRAPRRFPDSDSVILFWVR